MKLTRLIWTRSSLTAIMSHPAQSQRKPLTKLLSSKPKRTYVDIVLMKQQSQDFLTHFVTSEKRETKSVSSNHIRVF